ncbi:MAG: hypothetical protein WD178_08795 [Actinomycetota bacterium]
MRCIVRRVLFCGLLAVLGACGPDADSADSDWESIASTQGRFSADFPVEPQRQTQRIPAVGEPLELVVYTAETATEALSVSYVDYPAPTTGEEIGRILDAAVEGVVSALQGQNLTKKPGSLLGHEAIDYTVEVNTQTVVGKVFLVDARMYTLQLARAKAADSDSFDRLVESFKLIPGVATTPEPSPTLSIAFPTGPSAAPAEEPSPPPAPSAATATPALPAPVTNP